MCPGAASLNHRGRSARLADTDVPTLEMYMYYYPDKVASLKGVPYCTEPLWFRDWSLKNYSTDKYGKHYLWTWPLGDTYRDIKSGEYRGEVQCLSITIKEDTSWYGATGASVRWQTAVV